MNEALAIASPWAAQLLAQHPEWSADPVFARAYTPGEMAQRVQAACTEPGTLASALRRARAFEMTRIVVRAVQGCSLDETLHDLSDFADAACALALDAAHAELAARFGTPRDEEGREVRGFILGMGKLGGRELNFSSDIDLIFTYRAGGETDGKTSLANGDFFARVVQRFTGLLSERTHEGFVFRVDWMLRPFGSAGAPAISAAAMEDYYQTHGREWERYALVKARVVAGDAAAGAALLEALSPFVYRRYFDYNAVARLRELKVMIEDDMRRKGAPDHLKLGHGGIREVEFIVQAQQLVRGGQERALRDTQLRRCLSTLVREKRMERGLAQSLDAAYVFLRRAENAVQMFGDEQLHILPTDTERQAALCAALDFADWAALREALDAHRQLVRRQFEQTFAAPAAATASPLLRVLQSMWSAPPEDGTIDAGLREPLLALGYQEPEDVAENLRSLRRARLTRLMKEDATAQLLQLLSAVIEECATQTDASRSAVRVLGVIQAIVGRSTYLTLLRENRTARAQLIRLCAASPWLTDLLARSPALLDALMDAEALVRPPSAEAMRIELSERMARIPAGDTEAAMDLLRRYQKDTTLRVAAADLLHGLPLVKVSDHLTWLAEAILQSALDFARADLSHQHGLPKRSDGAAVQIAAIAYGKFGGLEMSYGSDLDLVFLHDCDQLQADTAGGARSIPAETWLTRLVQRVISLLSAQTHLGRAYEVDLELRPDGRRGMSISGFAGFAQYQRENAWTWEHQALTRARFVAGDTALGAAFTALRREVLCRPREPAKLREEILAMRQKMRDNLDASNDEHWDLKQGAGGLIDLEFITQFLVLRDAARDARIVEYSDNWRQLDALEQAQSITSEQKAILIETYRLHRASAHRLALQNSETRLPASQFEAERATINLLWKQILQ